MSRTSFQVRTTRRQSAPVPLTHATFLAATILVASCAGQSGGPPPVDVAAIKAVITAREDSMIAAEAAKDSARSASYFADDAIVQGANMPEVHGRAEMEKFYGAMFPMVKEMGTTRSNLFVAASGDIAWEYGVNRTTMVGATTPIPGKYLAVWKKVGSEWLVAALSFSDDAAPPPEPAKGGAR